MALRGVVLGHGPRRDEVGFSGHEPEIGSGLLSEGRPWTVEHADVSTWLVETRLVCVAGDHPRMPS